MKKLIPILLIVALVFSGCANQDMIKEARTASNKLFWNDKLQITVLVDTASQEESEAFLSRGWISVEGEVLYMLATHDADYCETIRFEKGPYQGRRWMICAKSKQHGSSAESAEDSGFDRVNQLLGWSRKSLVDAPTHCGSFFHCSYIDEDVTPDLVMGALGTIR